MAIFDGGDRGLRATIAWKHPGADLAFLNAGERAATLRFSRDPLVAGQDGFAIGFPKGNPGWVHGRLIERTRLRMRDVHSGDAPTLEWAEVGRSPSGLSALAGASGSPMLDERGHVVGVLVSSQRRRGRFTTTAPESLAPMAADGPRVIWAGRGSRSAAIDAASIDSVSERLRHARQVAIANCYVDK
jgi:S1-C subfamily serine protease